MTNRTSRLQVLIGTSRSYESTISPFVGLITRTRPVEVTATSSRSPSLSRSPRLGRSFSSLPATSSRSWPPAPSRSTAQRLSRTPVKPISRSWHWWSDTPCARFGSSRAPSSRDDSIRAPESLSDKSCIIDRCTAAGSTVLSGCTREPKRQFAVEASSQGSGITDDPRAPPCSFRHSRLALGQGACTPYRVDARGRFLSSHRWTRRGRALPPPVVVISVDNSGTRDAAGTNTGRRSRSRRDSKYTSPSLVGTWFRRGDGGVAPRRSLLCSHNRPATQRREDMNETGRHVARCVWTAPGIRFNDLAPGQVHTTSNGSS